MEKLEELGHGVDKVSRSTGLSKLPVYEVLYPMSARG